MAGGQSRWVAAANRMEPAGKVEGVEIVGAAAGWRSTTACLESAAAGVAILLGRRPEPVEDKLIDPAFETPDDPTPIAATADADAIAYLDAGQSLAERPAPSGRPKGIRGWFSRGDAPGKFLAQARALSVGDIAAAVQLGAVAAATPAPSRRNAASSPATSCRWSRSRRRLARSRPRIDAPPYPVYLTGRFGTDAKVWRVESADKRTFETGCLIYSNSDKTDPLAAVGVVLHAERDGASALIGGQRAGGDALVVRDLSGPIGVHLVEPPKAGARGLAGLGDALAEHGVLRPPHHLGILAVEAQLRHLDRRFEPLARDGIGRVLPQRLEVALELLLQRRPHLRPGLVEHRVERQRVAALAHRRQQIDAVERRQQLVAVEPVGGTRRCAAARG